jgi:hypothetical protein
MDDDYEYVTRVLDAVMRPDWNDPVDDSDAWAEYILNENVSVDFDEIWNEFFDPEVQYVDREKGG